MSKVPPPENDIPDYFFGRLVFYDDSEGLKWVVYDGRHKIRFSSRKAAETWCLEQSALFSKEEVGEWMRAYQHLRYAYGILDECNQFIHHRELGELALAIRKLSDRLDTMIAQYGIQE